MRVIVSSAGRFHAFHLVEQLYQRGHLERFITTTLNKTLLPNRKLPSSLDGNSDFLKRVVCIPAPEYACYGLRKAPVRNAQSIAYFVKDNSYDRSAVQSIPNGDLFVGWASQSLFQLREAKTRGARTIVERGSTHISEQYRLIEDEHKKFGVLAPTRSSWDRMLEEKQLKEYHEADYIMVPSEFARQSFLNRGFRKEKLLKVRYGVDLESFYPVERSTWPNEPTILFVGAIGFQKGIPYLLEAVNRLRAQGKKCRLKFIGRYEKDFAKWLSTSTLRSEIDEHVTFVPNSELVAHFHDAQIFCLPSVQEGLALVIAEAMASGLPVVATENTGAAEFMQQNVHGNIVAAGNAELLASALASLLDDPARAIYCGSKAAEASKSFGWNSYGDAIELTYLSILSRHEARETGDKQPASEIQDYYNDYWNREHGWTPTHSFTDDQLDLHFANAFRETDTVLDVGSGDASNYQAWLVKKVDKLAAIDISESGVATAKRMGLDATVHDLSRPFPYSDNSFDGAVCIEVLEHLYDPKFAVMEMYRVLKPGGLLIASVPNNGYFRERMKALTRAELSTSITDFSNEWKGAHIRFYNLRSFTRMLEIAGLQVESARSNQDASIFDGFDAFGGYMTQHVTSALRKKLPRALRLAFLENIWPSLFAPHIVVRARKPLNE
jgi:glycosyltransferase involved in cell wall biosynthesis/SAM-dependent methyltransferase